jgi:hypothetical protein
MTTSRKSVNLLPAFFRTEKNSKFLSSTLDQLISVPQLNRIDAFVGSTNTPTYQAGDLYLPETNELRKAYQLEPALVVKTLDQEIKKAFALDDLLNQITSYGGNSSNLDRIFNPKFYSYDPKIDWDKFVNFRDYYWLPNGPSSITVTGGQKNPVVEYTVTDADDGIQFLFGGLVTTEQLVLYRGYTYVFNVNSKHNFNIKYSNRVGPDDSVINHITGNGTNNGQIIFTVDWSVPDNLYYTSNDNQLSTGNIIVKEPNLNSTIDVNDEILGKKYYTTSDKIKFINGLKVKFEGNVSPEEYKDAEFIVEGVGNSIQLIKFKDLDTPDSTADLYNSKFDGTNFDEFPFDDFKNIPLVPEYITINRASKDRNPWSRYNRWVHKDVITLTAKYSNTQVVYPENYKARRPIVEFVANIKLFNFGYSALQNIDLIDNTVTSTFNQVEGQVGYYIDGVLLEEGFRVIFNADADSLVRNRIYRVTFSINSANLSVISLVAEDDIVENGASILVRRGNLHAGSSWNHNGISWLYSQQRTARNQAPLFDLFDDKGISYTDSAVYSTNFAGNKLFGYGIGSGVNDSILGFPLLYKNTGVEGTFLFKNYFSTESFILIKQPATLTVQTSKTYFKVDSQLSSVWVTGEPYIIPNTNGIYEVPLNLTNNPMNGNISEFTLTELADHLTSMTSRDPEFTGTNLKDLPDIGKYGTRLISNLNPLSFANHFIADQENSLVNSTRLVGEHYYQFKFNLLDAMQNIEQGIDPSEALDIIIATLNKSKTTTFPYYRSDMIASGNGAIIRTYKVTDSRNKKYFLPTKYNPSVLSSTGVLIYVNGVQLLHKKEYVFDEYDSNVEILISLARGDTVVVKQFNNTDGSFIPPTPTKLGLYPKFEPMLFTDLTFANGPQDVIQGHDGSITLAFGDYRDDILLEFEKRVYNNIKVSYNQDLFDINSVLPGIFRTHEYSYSEIFNPVYRDFLKWKTTYGVETEKNLAFSIDNTKTFNYSSIVLPNGETAPGNWRAIFKLYFDTDRPHTHPWEMLGFSEKPTWWETYYGPAPYTSGNDLLWKDLEDGRIVQGDREGVHAIYSRPGLSNMLPVDENGNPLDVRDWGIIGMEGSLSSANAGWKFADSGPAETSWRRSSYWPFAVQIILAVCKPALYTGTLFDTSRMVKNAVGNYVYSEDNLFVSPARMLLPYDTSNGSLVMTSGYSVFVMEAGTIRNSNYPSQLKIELENSNFNLMNKTGGFVSKDKLEVVIESIDPKSINPGILLPSEDYTIHFNVSNPVKTIAISGILIQKSQGKFVIRGYDKVDPFFNVLNPIHQRTDSNIAVGGRSEDYIIWSTNVFYSQGQAVLYKDSFYRVTGNHNSGNSFDPTHYKVLPVLPTIGGTVVQQASMFESTPTRVTYGSTFETIQQVADIMSGYGKWLESEGFMFTSYSKDIGQLLNWEFTVKEFLFWATQNWSENSVIVLSPFADKIEYRFTDSTVDDIFNSFYDYSLLKADGYAFPKDSFSISRTDGVCTITSNTERYGLFFARLRLIQKEHAIILNNTSRFNDIIYDIETGYRQRRIKLIGFKTIEWNGDYLSPGFIYDPAKIQSWLPYADYTAGDIVEYAGNYYSLIRNLPGKEKFDFNYWFKLDSKPQAQLIPNFEYKISQFEDFYSLDIDNFDASQQQLAQHLIGYSSRVYLDNIFLNPIAQYKFYQGFIKEKGSKNALDKLARASVHNLNGKITFNEEWAFRVGTLGAYSSEYELEFPLSESKFVDNTQLIRFVNEKPTLAYDATVYISPSDLSMKPLDYVPDTTFSTLSANNQDLIVMPVAGYVRLEDVDFALKTKQDLYNFIPGKTIKIGDTIWIGFDDNGDWGVYRYARLAQVIVSAEAFVYGHSVIFTTDKYHQLKVGDIVAISRFSDTLNGIYKIESIPHINQFVVSTPNEIGTTNEFGILFKFISSRYDSFDNLVTSEYVADIIIGKSVWIDNSASGKWQVYTKIKNYNVNRVRGAIGDSSYFGKTIISKESSNRVIVSAPLYDDGAGAGKIFVYSNIISPKVILSYSINSFNDQYYRNTTSPRPAAFGTAMDFDSADGIIVAGAPYASYVKGDVNVDTRFVRSNNTASTYVNEGLVTISVVNEETATETNRLTLACQTPADYIEFGRSVFVGSVPTIKTLLVGAPGFSNNTGKVFAYDLAYNITFDGQTVTINATNTSYNAITPPVEITNDSRFGESITGNLTASLIAVSAPGLHGNGVVCIFKFNSTTVDYDFVQTITPATSSDTLTPNLSNGSNFGSSISMDDTGEWLFISAPDATDKVLQPGKVLIYKNTTGTFVLNQIINNPSSSAGLKFGHKLDTDDTGQLLGVTSIGPTNYSGMIFDSASTTFDSASTNFSEYISDAGTAYTFNRYNDKFVFASELFDAYITDGSAYGDSISVNRSAVYVGAPLYITTSTTKAGEFYAWNAINPDSNSWSLAREETGLVDTNRIKQIKTIDTFAETVDDYLEIYDPVKGRISQAADQELRYRTVFDPAVYNTGTSTSIVVDSQTYWGNEHVGELWWDLSTLKYQWYEQGESEYRKNSWGAVFPGCTIDVCEWVSSDFTPDQWASQADTIAGLAVSISGQPKYLSDLAYSLEQVYSPITDTYTNRYYYWVKNTVVVPNRQGRNISAYEVANLISNPKSAGLKYVAVLSSSSLAVNNIKGSLVNDRISLNMQLDNIDNKNNKHTEWLLIEEGSAHSLPNTLLEKKLIDSLLGRDSVGNIVPDPSLSARQKYGIGIRPRQSMFKNRANALRNMVAYVNQVFADNLITDFYNLDKFNDKDEISQIPINQYDLIVQDLDARDALYTGDFIQAELTCLLVNGKISSIDIVTPGYGYGKLEAYSYDDQGNIISWKGPEVLIFDDVNGAEFETVIDQYGSIISVLIKNSGNNYSSRPRLYVRPYTVIVQTDSESRNRWTLYSLMSNSWTKIRTQGHDTTLYWDYINWVAPEFNQYQAMAAIVDQSYQLAELNLGIGDYVKINNNGAGRYLILKKISTGSGGTYNLDYDVMVSEKGTLQIKDSIWNILNSQFGWDQISPYDETFFDQIPDIELEKIIYALKNDIFIGNLKVYWNKFFFTAIKYVLTEQKVVDWLFKSSFINVTNSAGELTQRPVYKFQDTTWYEDYLNEIKPYHTQVREYKLEYSVTEPSLTFTTDFDLPVVYDKNTGIYSSLDIGSPLLKTYPYKGWFDNHTLFLDSVAISNGGGSGYTEVPEIRIISAPSDTGVTSTATAVALIASGKVVGAYVTNPGVGYTVNPSIVLVGGGAVTVPAKLSPIMSNKKVRVNKIGLKFDRVSRSREVLTKTVTDTFTANGIQTEFNLTWLASQDKTGVTLTADGIFIIPSNYSLTEYSTTVNGYTKLLTKLTTKVQYDQGTVISITYDKSLKTYNAYDRIHDYYLPTAGMPGKTQDDNYAQLMKGMEYPGTTIQTVPFESDFSWDSVPFGSLLWDPASSQTVDLDTIYNGGTISTSTPWVSEHWTSVPHGLTMQKTPSNSSSYPPITVIPGTGSYSSNNLYHGVDQVPPAQWSDNGTYPSGTPCRLDLVGATGDWARYNGVTLYIRNNNGVNINLCTDSTFNNLISAPTGTFASGTLTLLDWTLGEVQSTSTPWVSGHWTSISLGATGVAPEEIILDGDQFISPIRTYAPEELVPGHVTETLGINIFTRKSSGSSMILTLRHDATNNQPTVVQLSLPLPSSGAIFVSYNYETLIPGLEYVIDYTKNTVTVYPRADDGSIEIIYMPGVGGTGFLSANSIMVEGTSLGSVIGDCAYSEVKSIYVTLNGQHINPDSGQAGQGLYYTTSEADPGVNNRIMVTVHGLGTLGKNVIFAAFFASEYKGFSELREQMVYNVNANNRIVTLDQPPGVLGPASANSIVEVNGVRIVPPNTTYYEITNTGQTRFDISTRRAFPHNTFDMTMLEVYKNGVRVPLNIYYLDQYNNVIIFPSNYFALGDVLAITAIIDYDYIIRGSTLEITNRIPLDAPTNIVRIITFTNQDEQYIRTEVYLANSARLYKLSRVVYNDNYVWISIGNRTLVPGFDFVILDDNKSIQVDMDLPYVEGEQVVITSLAQTSANRSTSFKIFKDSIGRTSYRRLSDEETTYLVQPLQLTDTQIVVENGDRFPSLSPGATSPGVVFIAGERIEYLEKVGNTLSKIRRATLGTGAKPYYTVGSWVIDQSQVQNMPVTDTVVVTTTSTNGNASYRLSNKLSFVSGANYHDQVEVYFGGRQLEKPTAPGVVRYSHDYSLPPDLGSTPLDPGFTITTSTVNSSTVYTLNLPFTPPVGVELKVVQRTGKSWYVTKTYSLLDENSATALFLNDRSGITVDQLYYGGDPVLRFGDGTALTLDDGRPIEGY